MPGSLLTQWTIRLALVCLVIYWSGLLWLTCRKTRAETAKFAALRWIWTAGCVLFIAHVASAFHFTHHWSHHHAWLHTEAETQRLMGFSFGDGIYFSYVFLLLWVADVCLLWLNVARPTWLLASVHTFLFFIAFNGAIVFEDGPTRPVGMAVVVVLAALFAVVVWMRASNRISDNAHPKLGSAPSGAEAEA